jgi:hypothetical protein
MRLQFVAVQGLGQNAREERICVQQSAGDGVTEIMKIGTPKGRRGCHVIEVIPEALRHRSEARI